MKRNIIFAAAACFAFITAAAYGRELIKTDESLCINGNEVKTQVYNDENDKTFVPLRTVFEYVGGDVSYDAETKTAVVSYEGKSIEVSQYDSKNTVFLNGSIYLLVDYITDVFSFETGINQQGEIYINTAETDTAEINTAKSNTADSDNTAETDTAAAEEAETLTDGSAFAYKLDSLMDKDENYVFSPVSLKYALAMAANGADEQTKTEIVKALAINSLDEFNKEAKAYMESSEQKYEPLEGSAIGFDLEEDLLVSVGTGLSIANSIWLNEDRIEGGDFSESFKSLVKESYNGEAETVTNKNAVEKINSWCSENTNEKIDRIINNSDFIAALVNAVYFKGAWSNEFSKGMTAPDTFTNSDGTEAEIDFMKQTDYFKYYGDENIKIISLPYDNSNISMYVSLTENDNINPLEYADRTERVKVNVKMPKFETETSLNASGLLKKLGIELAFDDSENAFHFTNMFNDVVNNSGSVYISDVLHKTYISVDEEGTEAAAVSAAMMDLAAAAPGDEEIYEFTADRPFTYFIRDDSNGEILFMGRYSKGE